MLWIMSGIVTVDKFWKWSRTHLLTAQTLAGMDFLKKKKYVRSRLSSHL